MELDYGYMGRSVKAPKVSKGQANRAGQPRGCGLVLRRGVCASCAWLERTSARLLDQASRQQPGKGCLIRTGGSELVPEQRASTIHGAVMLAAASPASPGYVAVRVYWPGSKGSAACNWTCMISGAQESCDMKMLHCIANGSVPMSCAVITYLLLQARRQSEPPGVIAASWQAERQGLLWTGQEDAVITSQLPWWTSPSRSFVWIPGNPRYSISQTSGRDGIPHLFGSFEALTLVGQEAAELVVCAQLIVDVVQGVVS